MSVYLEAAKDVHEEREVFACWAINRRASGSARTSLQAQRFSKLFSPEGQSPEVPWGVYWGVEGKRISGRACRECRVLALCLMAAIAEGS